MVWIGSNSKIIWSIPPALSRDILHQVRLLRAPSNLTLNMSSDGAADSSSRQSREEQPSWKAAVRPLWSLSSPCWTTSGLSAFLYGSSPLIIFEVPCGLTPADPHLSCTGNTRTGYSALSGVSQKQRRGWELFPSACCPHLFWCSPGYDWLSGLQALIASSCPIFSLPESQCSSVACFQSWILFQFTQQSVLVLGIATA